MRLAERERFKAANGFSLTYLPFVARAVVDALEEWPYLNSSVGEDELIVHGEVNLGFAVDLEFEGLLVPVVHRAEESAWSHSLVTSPTSPPELAASD